MSFVQGGSFMLQQQDYEEIFTPEDINEEQKMIAEATRQFVESEVEPQDAAIEQLSYEVTRSLLLKAGEAGLLGADIPEDYGGLQLDKISSMLIGEKLSRASSFALSVGAHVGIGTLPIVFFGSEEQKHKYLPKLATGEWIAAYCLTEPGSGSDALGAQTVAQLNPEGTHYILNGSKLYITNAGFADVFIVYAKVNRTDFTAFIVERNTVGLTIGPEEKKMGIKGSSTCPLYFHEMKVPVEQVLGEVGKGHIIAFNILNIGRYKLAAGCLGASKDTVEYSVKYANQRKQFGKVLSSFPLIQEKIAGMNIRTFVLESMVYRTAGLYEDITQAFTQQGALLDGRKAAKAMAEYAIECSMNKVFGSEVLSDIADEGVQIHGGYGYIQEYRVERIYRDARINRIFEGTNEINRLLIPATLLKRGMKGELPLMERFTQLQAELMDMESMNASIEQIPEELKAEFKLLYCFKVAFLMVGGSAVQRYGQRLEEEQELLRILADLMIDTFALESALLRTRKALDHRPTECGLLVRMTQAFAQEAAVRVEQSCKLALTALHQGDSLRTQLALLRKLMKSPDRNRIALHREIAAAVIAAERYTT